ncbi:restriction endonuclease subunit S [Clostridium sp. OM05-5BH]|uniref:restriction endonuclease subunit S n=1 Tax=unclassified Clostridium TaxID=2614128 RepID=UPI000E526882|nr:restriction endonuclease subunit S [Clostridium sp. OM05-5BH]RHV27619.1 restriction endonuclease subunit S [Clostridium sp. OM05-5BH]
MKLNEVCIGITDGSHNPPAGIKKSEYPMLSSKNIFDDVLTFDEPRYLSETEYEKENKRTCVNAGDVLLTIVGTVGRALVVPEGADNITLQRSVAVLHPNYEKCRSRYLMYLLQSKRSYFENKARGVAQKGIYLKQLSDVDVNICGLDEQDEIIKLLDKTRNIITVRRKQLEQLDLLVKARFVEMFGDRYVNDKKWNTTKLGEGISFNNGKAHEQVVDENGDYILVTSRAIASDFEDVRRTNTLLFPLHKNDIVMVMSDVPNGKALAKCQLIDSDDKYTLNQRICSFDNYEYNAIFLLYLLNRHPYFLAFNDGNGQTNLRKNDILECELIVPPIELQNQFADFVRQVDKSKAVVQKSLEETQLLFDSLMQKYFG